MNSNAAANEAARTYQNHDIETADPMVLVVRVLEIGSMSMAKARATLAEGDVSAKGRHVERACRCVALLQSNLDMEQGEVARNLDRVYTYLQGRITAGHLHNDGEAFAEVGKHFSELASAWREAASRRGRPEARVRAPETVAPR